MKKTKKILSILLCLTISFLFVGCQNQNETLAKNLDDTVTNLIYSVSSLDWADSTSLNNFLNNPSSQNENLSLVENQNSNVSLTKTIDCDNCDDNTCDNCLDENCDNCEQNIDENSYITNPSNNTYNNPTSNINDNYQNQTNDQKTNVSTKVQNTNTNTNNLNNTSISSKAIVTFATQEITDSANRVQEIISELISKRANILLLIDQIYSGKANLSQDDISAINAYMNIIKENTSYLNSNKGIVTNQLSKAKELFTSNSASPLINAYIIRTNEAIETRISKLESSLLAIDSICEIIENGGNSTDNLTNNNSIQNTSNKSLGTIKRTTNNSSINNNSDSLNLNNIDENISNNTNTESISNMNTRVRVNPRKNQNLPSYPGSVIPNTNETTNELFNNRASTNIYNPYSPTPPYYNPINNIEAQEIIQRQLPNDGIDKNVINQKVNYLDNSITNPINPNIDPNIEFANNMRNKYADRYSSNTTSQNLEEVNQENEESETLSYGKNRTTEIQDELLVKKQKTKEEIVKNNADNKSRETQQEIYQRDKSNNDHSNKSIEQSNNELSINENNDQKESYEEDTSSPDNSETLEQNKSQDEDKDNNNNLITPKNFIEDKNNNDKRLKTSNQKNDVGYVVNRSEKIKNMPYRK